MKAIIDISFKRLLQQKILIMVMCCFPFLPLIILIAPSSESMILISYSLFGLLLMFSSIFLTKQLIDDRQEKVIIRIDSSPVTHGQYLTAHLFVYCCVVFSQILLFTTVGLLLFDVSNIFLIIGTIHLFGFGILTISFALFWHTLFSSFATSIAIYSIVANIIALLGGLTFPLYMLPDNIRQVSVIFPSYWYAYGMSLILEKKYYQSIINLLIVLGFAIIFLMLGSKRRFE